MSAARISQRLGSPKDYWLPLQPLWPGYAINTIFYGAMLWILFATPRSVRRRLRRRRGLCPACAYDLRGSASQSCPECGRPVDQNRARQEAAA
jgi:hypothetical protein